MVLFAKILYDCGQSLNPVIDCGQAEGGFFQGLGHYLREKVVENAESGELMTDGTWEYKIPSSQDVPLDFQVEFFQTFWNASGTIFCPRPIFLPIRQAKA